MSATAPTSALENSSTRPRWLRVPEWLREPLLHFVILGGVLFAADHLLYARKSDPNTIVVGKDVDGEEREMFKLSRGRDPNERELAAMHRVYIDNEVLYREGLAMQVDKGDQAIRDRVIFKALSVVDANVKLPVIDDKGLESWFEQHRSKYDQPARYTFDEAILAGDNSEASVRGFVAQLNSGTSGEAKAGLRVFKGRPFDNLVQSYGADFPKQLEDSPLGEWRALQTKTGWRAMHVNEITPAKPAAFADVRNSVLQDWKDTTASDLRTAAVRAMGKKYRIVYESGGEPE
jgi:hypothetical protein